VVVGDLLGPVMCAISVPRFFGLAKALEDPELLQYLFTGRVSNISTGFYFPLPRFLPTTVLSWSSSVSAIKNTMLSKTINWMREIFSTANQILLSILRARWSQRKTSSTQSRRYLSNLFMLA
jgi:hypothetical protein